jgi:hypothetical protein
MQSAFKTGAWAVPHIGGIGAWLESLTQAVAIPPLGSVGATVAAGGAEAGADTAAAGGAEIAGKGAAQTAAKAAAGLGVASGLADLLGATDIEAFVIRALEALVGIALIALGLQALTGTGSQGNPVQAVRSVAGAAKYVR